MGQQQFNSLPNYPVPLVIGRNTGKDWYFFFSGLFKGLAPAAETPITLTGSPFTFTAPVRGFVIVQGGTVSLVEFSRDGTTFYNYGTTAGPFPLSAADRLRITYTVLPTMIFVPQ